LLLTKTIEFEMGHRLMLHEGKCSNIHGHNYKVDITIWGIPDEQTGMVIDFGDLKKILKEVILDSHDHALALNREDKALVDFCVQGQMKHVLYDSDPTAEAMARRFFADLHRYFKELGPVMFVHSVTVWETSTAKATETK
jgi:6-pyruvoyltetrahydropterin/6-carboxytetrahydropterin synthase